MAMLTSTLRTRLRGVTASTSPILLSRVLLSSAILLDSEVHAIWGGKVDGDQDIAKASAKSEGVPLSEMFLDESDERVIAMVNEAANKKPYNWKQRKDTSLTRCPFGGGTLQRTLVSHPTESTHLITFCFTYFVYEHTT